jgi:ribulose-phosphate 3-epimerase
MALICPTVLAADEADFKLQIERISSFAHRIQIDITDSIFAPSKTIEPKDIWWPAGVRADIHIMYKDPLPAITQVAPHQPNMVIVHAESDGNFSDTLDYCRKHDIKLGVALLPGTEPQRIEPALKDLDHVLIFSGDLGNFGGHADLSLLEKVEFIKNKAPDIEVGWDGGINLMNVSELVTGGVDLLNVGGFIQKANDPQKAYSDLMRIVEETGTT